MRENLARIERKIIPHRGRIKWVKKENIHLTLKFLGEVDEEKVDKIGSKIGEICVNFSPFNLSFSSIGAFPNMRSPRVVWVGVKNGGKEVVELMKRIETALVSLGFEKEKRDKTPHITIGRFKNRGSLSFTNEVKDFGSRLFPVKELWLIRSELKREGPIYTSIAGYKLL